MPAYFVSGSDFCVPGFERLRCNNEILLVAYPTARQGARAICRGIISDLQHYGGLGQEFNYRAARKAIRKHFSDLAEQWQGANALAVFGRDAFSKHSEQSEPCTFYIYLTIPSWAQA